MCEGKYQQAQKVLDQCTNDVLYHGTYIEKACLHVTAARTARMLGKDPRQFLRLARELVHYNWPAMEKMILSELALLYDPKGLMPNANRLSQVCEQFGKITALVPGKCVWLLMWEARWLFYRAPIKVTAFYVPIYCFYHFSLHTVLLIRIVFFFVHRFSDELLFFNVNDLFSI